MIGLVGMLRRELSSLADLVADHIADRLMPALRAGPDPGDLAPLLQRGRMLMLQGSASLLADRLGAALLRRADRSEDGAALRAAIERIRVGAVTDSAGQIKPLVPR